MMYINIPSLKCTLWVGISLTGLKIVMLEQVFKVIQLYTILKNQNIPIGKRGD